MLRWYKTGKHTKCSLANDHSGWLSVQSIVHGVTNFFLKRIMGGFGLLDKLIKHHQWFNVCIWWCLFPYLNKMIIVLQLYHCYNLLVSCLKKTQSAKKVFIIIHPEIRLKKHLLGNDIPTNLMPMSQLVPISQPTYTALPGWDQNNNLQQFKHTNRWLRTFITRNRECWVTCNNNKAIVLPLPATRGSANIFCSDISSCWFEQWKLNMN